MTDLADYASVPLATQFDAPALSIGETLSDLAHILLFQGLRSLQADYDVPPLFISEFPLFRASIGTSTTYMTMSDDGFAFLAGSSIPRFTRNSLSGAGLRRREMWVASNAQKRGAEFYLTRDVEMYDLREAAFLLTGQTSDDLGIWKCAESGRPLSTWLQEFSTNFHNKGWQDTGTRGRPSECN